MNTTNRIYESMYIVDSGVSEEQLESIVAKYTQLIADQGGSVMAAGQWDKRRLAYDVQGHGDGIFVLMFFEGTPEMAKELDRIFRISDDVFRHLITRVEPEHVDTSRIGQPAAEEAAPAPPAAQAAEAVEEVAVEEAPAAEEEAEAEAPAVEEAPATEETPVAEESAPEEIAQEAPEADEPEAAGEAVEEPAEESEAAPETEKEP